MKVTKETILEIRPGQTKMFVLPDGKACNAARVAVQYVKRTCMPTGISDYKTLVDWKQNVISITAMS